MLQTTDTDALGFPLEAPPARARGGRPARADKARRCGQRKLVCRCGFICRATIGALERHGYPRCACGAELELAELADRIDAGDTDALEATERAELEALERRTRREARELEHGFAAGAANCGVCGRFKSRPADTCGYCGDDPVPHSPDRRREAEIVNRGAGYRR